MHPRDRRHGPCDVNLRRTAMTATRRAFLTALGALPTAAIQRNAAAFTEREYWAQKGDVRLYLYRKRRPGDAKLPVLFLVHGSSISGRSTFDLFVSNKDEY